MKLNLTHEASHGKGDMSGAEALSMAMGWLQKAREGRMGIPTAQGFVDPVDGGIEPEGVLVLMWWTKHPTINPVVITLDTPKQRAVYWEVPFDEDEGWNDYWADRFARDAEKLDREMNRGENGDKLSCFRLGTVAEVVDFIEGSLRAYEKSTH